MNYKKKYRPLVNVHIDKNIENIMERLRKN